jgi:hypothetical protein
LWRILKEMTENVSMASRKRGNDNRGGCCSDCRGGGSGVAHRKPQKRQKHVFGVRRRLRLLLLRVSDEREMPRREERLMKF